MLKLSSSEKGFLLTIAGFDPTGGGGILRDILTFRYFGFCGAAAITVNTVQNSKGVSSLSFTEASFLIRQLRAILDEVPVKGVKIGVPHREEEVNSRIAEIISYLSVPTVFDPVLSPTFGKEFVERVEVLKPLIEISAVLTPNYSEYLRLKELLYGKTFVVKGWPFGNEVCDILFVEGREADRVCHKKDGIVVRGTGCAFSSALTALLAKGLNLKEAFREAVDFITEYRKEAFEIEGAFQLYPSV